VQYDTEASQKFTSPVVTTGVPAYTVAVNMTTLPDATEVTPLPPEVTARLVLVAVLVCVAASIGIPHNINARMHQNPMWKARLPCRRDGLSTTTAGKEDCKENKILTIGTLSGTAMRIAGLEILKTEQL
jgi:hypothetical protein